MKVERSAGSVLYTKYPIVKPTYEYSGKKEEPFMRPSGFYALWTLRAILGKLSLSSNKD
jgi:hypothetical protein